jgi:hypothetical protein
MIRPRNLASGDCHPPFTTSVLLLFATIHLPLTVQCAEPLEVLAMIPANYPHRTLEHPFLHLPVMESLAPLRFTLMEEQPDIDNYHAIDGQSLYSQNDANIEPARKLFRQAMLDAVQARQYDGIWLFGSSWRFSAEVRAALRAARAAGVPVLAWNADAATLAGLGLELPQSRLSSLPVDRGDQLRPGLANWSFEEVTEGAGEYDDEIIPVGTSVESAHEQESRIGSAEGFEGERSFKVFFPGGRNGTFATIGALDVPEDLNLHYVPVTITGHVKGRGASYLFLRDLDTGREAGRVGSLPQSPDQWRQFSFTSRLPKSKDNSLGLSVRLYSRGTIHLDAIRVTSAEILRKRAADLAPVRERFGGEIPRWERAQHVLLGDDYPDHARTAIPGLVNNAAVGMTPLVFSSFQGDVALAAFNGQGGRVVAANPGGVPLLRDGHESQDAWYWYRTLCWLSGKQTPKPRPGTRHEELLELNISTVPEFAIPGEEVTISVHPPAEMNTKGARLTVAVRDMRGRLLDEMVSKLGEPPPWKIGWRVPDIGPQGTIFRVHATVSVDDATIAQATATLNTQRKYDPRESIYYGTWLNRTSSSALVMRWLKRFYDGAGINSVTVRDTATLERYGWLGQFEAGNGGIDMQFGFPAGREDFIKRWHDEREMLYTQSSAFNLISWGEEPGFGKAFGTTWHWDGDPPAECVRWFRLYLRETYGQIEVLNRAWRADFIDFKQVPFSKDYMGKTVPLRELKEGIEMLDFKSYRIELDLTKDKQLPYLARHHDTRRFFYWYFDQIVATLTKDALQRYPWTQHFCSQPNVFDPRTPTPGGYNHPFYPKENVLYACMRHRARGHNNPLGRLEWYFVDDPAIQHTLQQSMAVGASYFVAWYAMPLQFHGDLTNTQGGARMNRILADLRKNAEGPYLQNYYDPAGPVGIMGNASPFHGTDTFGVAFPGFLNLVPCVLQTGQMPREIIPERLNDPNLRVLFLADRMVSDETLTQLHSFVQRGGTLITLPGAAAWDDHGIPVGAYMSPQLVNLTGVNPRYGKQTAQKMAWRQQAPIAPDFTPVEGTLLRLKIPETSYERLDIIADDVKVCAAYPDGTPAVTSRLVGNGRVIHLNTECGGNVGSKSWHHGSVPHRYAFTRIFQAIFAHARLGEPLPRLVNGRTDLGPHQVLWQRTSNATGDVSYVHAYIDPRAGSLDARILLPKDVRLRNLLTGEEISKSKDSSAPLHFDFLQFHLIALRSADPTDMSLTVAGSGRRKTIGVVLRGKHGAPWAGQRPVRLSFFRPDGTEHENLRRWISVTGQAKITHIAALDDADGRWIVEAFEPISRLRTRAELKVSRQRQPAQGVQAGLAGGPPEETAELLRQLTSLYEEANSRPRLSYYLHMRHDSRQSIMRRLERINWLDAHGEILNALRKGETFILTGEDMGIFPGTPHPTHYLYDNHAVECIQTLLNAADQVSVPEKWPSTLVCRFGEGRLLLDRTSIDETFPPGQEFQLGFPHRASQMGEWINRWRNKLNTPGFNDTLEPHNRVKLKSWLAGEAPALNSGSP